MLALRSARRLSFHWSRTRHHEVTRIPPRRTSQRMLASRITENEKKLFGIRCYSSDFSSVPHIKVTLPALSPTMEVGTIVSWEKKEGDVLAEGDLLCEIETDKATMGFETPEEGYLAKIILPSGAKDIPIGRLLCVIVENESDLPKFKDFVDDGEVSTSTSSPPAPSVPTPDPAPPSPSLQSQPPPSLFSPPASSSSNRLFASPAAKRLAKERNIDLSLITSGSGMDGMIISKDVESFVAPTVAPSGISLGLTPGVMSQGGYSDAELGAMRKTIAKRLQGSKHEIPHYYLSMEVVMDSVLSLRKEMNASYEKEGIKLTLNDFIVKATALACKRVPTVNSAWMGDTIREYHTCDVSIAVDTGSGLITPIVTGAESKGLGEISDSIKEMASRAKEGKLQPHEFMGGTITISNLGMFGISHFTAIINPPQSCILAVGATSQKAVAASDGTFKSVNVMKVTLSCDHRVVDGAIGAQWLQHFKKFIEKPTSMLL